MDDKFPLQKGLVSLQNYISWEMLYLSPTKITDFHVALRSEVINTEASKM